jgi:hypothetical protein
MVKRGHLIAAVREKMHLEVRLLHLLKERVRGHKQIMEKQVM